MKFAIKGQSNIRCAICLHPNQKSIGINPDFAGTDILRCKSCGFMWTHPMPEEDYVSRLYEKEYRELRKEKPTSEYLDLMDKRAISQFDYISKHSEARLNDAEVLDVGCSAGSLLNILSKITINLSGFEPDENMLDMARSRLPSSTKLFHGVFCGREFADNTFHLVTVSHVLEHSADPIALLSELLRIMRKDGAIFLEVPHETEWSLREVAAAKYRGLMHLVFFNPDTLIAGITKAGGKIDYLSTYGPNRRKYSYVSPDQGNWERRLNWGSYRIVHKAAQVFRVPLTNPFRLRWESALATETPRQGIWIRAIVQKGD